MIASKLPLLLRKLTFVAITHIDPEQAEPPQGEMPNIRVYLNALIRRIS